MKSRIISIFLVISLCFAFPVFAFADTTESLQVETEIANMQVDEEISPAYVYQFLHWHQQYFMSSYAHPNQLYVTNVATGRFKPNGDEYMAQGYLYFDNVIYDVPWAGYKTVWYSGYVTAYID